MNHNFPWGDSPDALDHDLPTSCDIRWSLVSRIRREIECGGYDTPEKLDAALDAMYDSLAESSFG